MGNSDSRAGRRPKALGRSVRWNQIWIEWKENAQFWGEVGEKATNGRKWEPVRIEDDFELTE